MITRSSGTITQVATIESSPVNRPWSRGSQGKVLDNFAGQKLNDISPEPTEAEGVGYAWCLYPVLKERYRLMLRDDNDRRL